MTIIRSRITVACWLETLGCWMTREARPGSRPMTNWPGAACTVPRTIMHRVMAGWFSGTVAAPTLNWVRMSKGTCSPGDSGRPLAVAAPAPQTKMSCPPPWWTMRACSG
jgi:hypothetical protein